MPFDRLGGCGAAFRAPLLLDVELDPELGFAVEPGVVVVVDPEGPAPGAVAGAPLPSDPDPSVTVVLAEVDCGRASRTANRPVAPAAATTSQRVMRLTRCRCRSRWRGEMLTPPSNARKL